MTRKIILLNQDLMSAMGIMNMCKALGFDCSRVDSAAEFSELLNGDTSAIALAIVDMNTSVDWTVVESAIQSSDTPVLAFGPHVDAEKMRAAKNAGVTRVTSNGQFRPNMAEFIERYARTCA